MKCEPSEAGESRDEANASGRSDRRVIEVPGEFHTKRGAEAVKITACEWVIND